MNITIVGNGKSNIGGSIALLKNSDVHYIFTPNASHCLYNVEINGVAVSSKELVRMAEKGFRVENIQEDLSIVVTFAEGVYLYIETGENIKNAYVSRTNNGKIEYFYSGQCVPTSGRLGSIGSFTLYVHFIPTTLSRR